MANGQGRKDTSRPPILFINSQTELLTPQARRLARRHASWWGHRRSRAGQSADKPTLTSLSTPTSAGHSHTPSSSDNSCGSLCQRSPPVVGLSSPRQAAPLDCYLGSTHDAFHILPQLSIPSDDSNYLSSLKHDMHLFFGEAFVRNTILRSGDCCESRYAGCLLLYSTYRHAVTGHGSRASLLSLKGIVIRKVNSALAKPGQATTLDNMIAIMSLGVPMVCQVTASSADETTQSQSLARSSLDNVSDQLPPTRGGALGEKIAREYDMHYRAITKLMRMQEDPAWLVTTDGRYIFLTKVLSYAHWMLANSEETQESWSKILQKFELHSSKAPAQTGWLSPLYCPNVALWRMALGAEMPPKVTRLLLSFQTWYRLYRSGEDVAAHTASMRVLLQQDRLEIDVSNESYVESLSCHQEGELRYEACCIVISLMIEAEGDGCSISQAAPLVPKSRALSHILRRTDLAHLWGRCPGVLYWVILICHMVVKQDLEHRISTMVLAHFTQTLAASDIPLPVAIQPIKELLAFP
ncbi:hypothetical protein PV08_09439 [Exophiala spinifera]|uniref:Transcription factor domain-containing protein n=1 Tax=Exophiala spinifera TaxID=91928 RepID=A0A0D2BLV2_9EURO|nr:uncharacterized protein PV08_09439 [Exophiala spinifera]KIW12164.1 hypothetical protein PV08_09439 [Exophiala spinifera]